LHLFEPDNIEMNSVHEHNGSGFCSTVANFCQKGSLLWTAKVYQSVHTIFS